MALVATSDTNTTASAENVTNAAGSSLTDTNNTTDSNSIVFAAAQSNTDSASTGTVETVSNVISVTLTDSNSSGDSLTTSTVVYIADANGSSDTYTVNVTTSASVAEINSTSTFESTGALTLGKATYQNKIDTTMLTQNAPGSINVFMRSSSDHMTAVTGTTPTVQISKAGSAFAAVSPVVTELGNGVYSLALTAAMTDTIGELMVLVQATGCDNSLITATVQQNTSGLSTDQATMLLEMYELLGLDPTKPLMVTGSSRTAGTISQTILTDANHTIVTRV